MTMAALPLPATAILLDSPTTSAVVALEQLAKILSINAGVESGHIYRALAAREAQGSTAIGSGVAVPHARLPLLDSPAVAALRSQQAIDFSAPDGVGVRIFVAVLVPESGTLEHLEILSRIAARLAQEDLRQRLLQVGDVDSFRSLLAT